MFHKALKWTFLISLWRRYGAIVRSLPIVILLLLFIWFAHSDFLDYAERSQAKQWLLQSFLIKWALILGIVFSYWRYLRRLLEPTKKKVKKASENDKNKVNAASDVEQRAFSNDSGKDVFASIRRKSKLNTKADQIIKAKK